LIVSKGGKGGGQETTTTSKIPDWLKGPYEGMLNFGAQVANLPYQQYKGETVARLDPMTQRAIDYTGQQQGLAGQQMQGFLPGLQGLAGYTPEQVQAGQFAGTDMAPYMNPYTGQVVNTTLAALERQRQQAIGQGQAQAQQAGAFGGSRHGVANALTNEAALRQAAETSAGLYGQGYQQAAQLRMSDIENQLRANLANQQAGLQGADLRRMSALGGAEVARQAQAANLQSAQAAQQAGQLRQQQAQAQLQDRYQRFQERRDYPEHQLQVMLAALGGAPSGVGSQTTQGPAGNPWLAGLGGALGGASLGSMIPGIGTGLGALGGGLLGLLG
jgi:hypothetical protein